MARDFPVRFFLADALSPVFPGDRRWQVPIPLHRTPASCRVQPLFAARPVCYADYFLAAEDFLRNLGEGAVAAAAFGREPGAAPPEELLTVDIFLEKHGAFYHPARVAVCCGQKTASLVLNVALAKEGRRCIDGEFGLLGKLFAINGRWLPEPFFSGAGRTPDGRRFPMFLGRWFEGFCEFHLSDAGDGILVWDPAAGPRRAAQWQRRELYRGVARILGDYYQPETGARIHPWHHAAGDFVARVDQDRVQLRLISVRGYPAPALSDPAGPEEALRRMLVDFLELSVRTRIDRADGTGALLWADASAVEPTLLGFVEALAEKSAADGPPAELLIELLAAFSEPDLTRLVLEAAEAGFSAAAPEFDLVLRHLAEHAAQVRTAARILSGGPASAGGTTR